MTTQERLMSYIALDENSCWTWTGYRDRGGYGRTWFDGKPGYLAHRAVYVTLRGPIPDDLPLDHLCRNHACVNPSHLEPVTQAENLRRGIKHQLTKTHCPEGHPYNEINTYLKPNGGRDCKACTARRQREYRARKQAMS